MDNVKVAAEQAYNTIVSNLAAPYFFEKLAANGIAPRSEKEATEMWSVANKLHVLYTAEQEKVAAASVSTLTAANQRLDGILKAAGLAESVEKKAAWDEVASLAADQADIASAVLTLQTAAAAAMQNAE